MLLVVMVNVRVAMIKENVLSLDYNIDPGVEH